MTKDIYYRTIMLSFIIAVSVESKSTRNDSTGIGSSDYDKLMMAIGAITSKFQSIDAILQAFGLTTLPIAQRYGILFGCMTFVCTIIAVIVLLILGGTFSRIAKQSSNDPSADGNIESSSPSAIRQQRSLLFEQLLEQRQRMMLRYSSKTSSNEMETDGNNNNLSITELTEMLCNVAPTTSTQNESNKNKSNDRYIPPGYEANYKHAYRQCQDRPGGAFYT
jgi:hypothetical protein